jgi:hypothetical protein
MVETNSLLPAESSCMDAVSMAFFRGMEEANKFLPSVVVRRGSDSETVVDDSSRKKGHESEAEAGGDMGHSRSSKQMAAPLLPESEEEATAREMLDRLMLDGYDSSLVVDMHEFHHVAMATEETRKSRWSGRRRSGTKQAVDMHALLIRCAEAIAANDWRGAAGLLARIKHNSSPTGDGTQRLAHCFAKGLEARLAGTGSQIYLSLVDKRASMIGVLKAYQLSMASGCFLPVQLLFSNKTIYKAVAGRKKLHIVDCGIYRPRDPMAGLAPVALAQGGWAAGGEAHRHRQATARVPSSLARRGNRAPAQCLRTPVWCPIRVPWRR